MKFIEFTNATEEHEDKKISINVDHIVTITVTDDDKTVLFGVNGSFWLVKETYETVMGMINT